MSDDSLKTILDRLEQLENDMEKRFSGLESDIKEVKITSEAYQKASTQIVNLASSLISAAAAVVILSPAVKALTEFFLSK
jgi:sugar-specific transcriptional regulator TrmB